MIPIAIHDTQPITVGHTLLTIKPSSSPVAVQKTVPLLPHSTLLGLKTPAFSLTQAHEFGTQIDGVIESGVSVRGHGSVEIGYYFGDSKSKNISKISTQVGCAAQCSFCEVGAESLKYNLTADEMIQEVALTLQLAYLRGIPVLTRPHKVNVAGTGDSLGNAHIVETIERLRALSLTVKASTVFLTGKRSQLIWQQIATLTAKDGPPVQMQVSLISTDEAYRMKQVGKAGASFSEIHEALIDWWRINPKGRKVNMSLILSQETPADPRQVYDLFPPHMVRFRFRDYIPTAAGTIAGLNPIEEARYQRIIKSFADRGYEVFDHARPTPTERQFGLASNVTRERMKTG